VLHSQSITKGSFHGQACFINFATGKTETTITTYLQATIAVELAKSIVSLSTLKVLQQMSL
jgi:hypothetical protein